MANPFANIGATKSSPAASGAPQNRFELIAAEPTPVPVAQTAPSPKKKGLFSTIDKEKGLAGEVKIPKAITRPIDRFFQISKPMTFPVGEGMTPEQKAAAEDQISKKYGGGAPITAEDLGLGNSLTLSKIGGQQAWEKKNPKWVAKYGPKYPDAKPVDPELMKAATEGIQAPVLGVVGGEDFVARQIAGGRVSNATLRQFAKESNPTKISESLQKVYQVPKDVADEIAGPLSKAKNIQEVKDVLTNTRPPEGPIVAENTPVTQKALPKPGQAIDETLSPQEILQKAEADAAHLGVKKPLAGRTQQKNPFAKIGMEVVPRVATQTPKADIFADTGKNTNPSEIPNNSIVEEAKKYKSAEEFISKMRGSATQYGDYSPELRKGGISEKDFRLPEKGIDPELEVTIYRGVPDTKSKIVDGDFVTTDRMSAESYAGRNNVISKKVKAKDLIYDDPDNFDPQNPFFTGAEFIYSDSKNPLTKYTEEKLTDIYNRATGKEMPEFSTSKTNIEDSLPPAPEKQPSISSTAIPAKTLRTDSATIEQLQRMLTRERESLAAARANPEAHAKAYGPDRIPKYEAKIASLQARIEAKRPKAPTFVPKRVKVSNAEIKLPNTLSQEQVRIEQKKLYLKEQLSDHPGRKLQALINKKEGDILDLKSILHLKKADPAKYEVLKARQDKIFNLAESALEGTKWSDRFSDPDAWREALAEYKAYREEMKQIFQDQKELHKKITEYVNSQKDEIALAKLAEKAGSMTDIRILRNERAAKKLTMINAVEKMLRAEGRNRAQKVSAIADFFNLTDKEMKEVLHGTPNYNVMSEPEFQNFLAGIQGKAFNVSERTAARVSLEGTIAAKELKKVENLREALKLKKFENMNVRELQEFEAALEPFQKGDEFLGKRQLETVKNTDLSGIHTKREALEVLSKKTGVPVTELDTIAINKKEKWVNRALYDGALARRNPFYRNMVEEFSRAEVESSIRFHDFRKKLNDLLINARRSRKRGFLDRAIPTDKLIFEWLSTADENKALVEKAMSRAEIEAATFIRDAYAEARDYLVTQGVLKRYRSNYITHTRRSFLEAWKDGTKEAGIWSGIKAAFTEILDSVKQDSAYFNILDQNTKEVLPLEKFFQYSLTRGDELIPSKNVARAVGNYFRAFEKKRMLDSIIPKIDIYAHVLTPSRMTPRGLEYDSSLKKFVKEWLNTKKGRATTLVVPSGTTMDLFMRGGVALTRVLDLALNIPVGIASHVGEQIMTFGAIGTKNYARGVRRFYTPQGKKIAEKYVGLVGETLADKLADASKNLTEKAATVFYSLFSSASRKANLVHILGSLSPEEFRSAEISVEHLAKIRNDMNKWRSIEGDTSILGKTPEGAVFTQYKSWAVPILHGTIDNVNKLIKIAASGKNPAKDPEVQELLRVTLTTAAILLTTYGFYDSLKNKKDRTFLENLAFKSANDGLSLFGGLSPQLWLGIPRFASFLTDLSQSLGNVAASLATGDRTKEGDIVGLKKLSSTVIPNAIEQILPSSTKEKVKTQMERTYEQVQQLAAEGRTEEAHAIVDAMTDAEYEEYKKVKASAKRDDTLQKKTEMLETVKQVRALQKDGKETEAYAIVNALSDADYEVYQSASKMLPADGSKPQFKENDAVPEKGLIHSVVTYAKAIGTDPITAFNRIFTGQTIRRVDNGAIIVERMSLEDSRAESKKQAGKNDTTGFRLDHTMPLQLGGSNAESNLKLIPEEVWASYTDTENLLGAALRSGKIKKKEAQDLIRRFKNGELTAEEVKNAL